MTSHIKEDGITFSTGGSISFGCTYNLSDQTLQSSYNVTRDSNDTDSDMDFDRHECELCFKALRLPLIFYCKFY